LSVLSRPGFSKYILSPFNDCLHYLITAFSFKQGHFSPRAHICQE
jgi:hypothetical protein